MANMIVSGAGSTEVNGTYVESGWLLNKPKYSYSNYEIHWTGYCWEIYGDYMSYYSSNDDVATPDLCSIWYVQDGSSPAPTVTIEGAAPTGIPKHFLYYSRMRGN